MRLIIVWCFLFITNLMSAQPFTSAEITRWKQQAQRITITRDNYGVPHIVGKTDADAVFGMLYAQCEDDFPRVEENYIVAMGRLAEVAGEAALIQDLRARLFLDTAQVIAIYQKSPAWMKKLLDAFADGANYYLQTHPDVKPRLIKRFQPWMPLLFSEGSIGGNISVVSLAPLKTFYNQHHSNSFIDYFPKKNWEPVGSNGFAIAPAKSASGNALLLINPHTSFYFRSELQMTSQEGLNAYGAVTWGQFFIYQGFNETCGWMHTSSGADAVDEYLETVEKRDTTYFYKYGKEWRPVQSKKIKLAYKIGDTLQTKTFTAYFTHHGPVIGAKDNQWITVRMMNEPLDALSQSYLRTKATDYQSFNKVMDIRTNSSNNTVFADSKGNIAYWHGNFMPKRNPAFNWNLPVDGTDPATEWNGLHAASEIVQLLNPAIGWIQNCNSTPFTAAGPDSPNKNKYPNYMAPDKENFRGIHAVQVLSRENKFDLDRLIAAAYDSYLPAFDDLMPALVQAYQYVNVADTSYHVSVPEAIVLLSKWDRRFSASSVPTTLAIYWAEKLYQLARSRAAAGQEFDQQSLNTFAIDITTVQEKIALLSEILTELTRDFGTWKTPWGNVNRFQRLNGAIQPVFDDAAPSLPIAFPSAAWGSLASFGARAYPNTKKRYGTYGNSFVAVVEFGKRVKARSITVGGASGDPTSKHFTDQASRYAEVRFKEVLFYPEDVKKNAERTYQPGK